MSITWNPSDKGANISLSNGDLTATATSTAWKAVRATDFKSSGKWYWEITIDVSANVNTMIGVGTSLETLTYPGDTLEGYGYYGSDGQKFHSSSSAYGAAYTAGDVMGTALDLDNGKIWWSKNGVWQASGDPATGANPAYTGVVGAFYPMYSPYDNTNAGTANFGGIAFSYSVPAGFSSLGYSGYFSGYVYEAGVPKQRVLFAYNRDQGGLVGTTTSSGDGYYYLETTYSGIHYIVCLDDVAGQSYNDLIIGNVIPTPISG